MKRSLIPGVLREKGMISLRLLFFRLVLHTACYPYFLIFLICISWKSFPLFSLHSSKHDSDSSKSRVYLVASCSFSLVIGPYVHKIGSYTLVDTTKNCRPGVKELGVSGFLLVELREKWSGWEVLFCLACLRAGWQRTDNFSFYDCHLSNQFR